MIDRDGPDRRLVFQRGRARGVGDPREVDVRGALRVDDVRRRVWRVCRFSTHPRGRRHARRLRTPRVSTAPFARARADAVERVARREPRLRRAERSRDASSRTRRGRGTSTRVRARRSTYVGRFRRRSRRSRRSRRGGFREEGRAFPPDVVSASRDAVRRRAHRRYGPRRDARVSRGRDRRRIVTGRLRTRVAPKRRAKLHRRTARDGGDDDTSHRGRGECGGRGRGRGRGEGGEGGGRGRGRGRGEGGRTPPRRRRRTPPRRRRRTPPRHSRTDFSFAFARRPTSRTWTTRGSRSRVLPGSTRGSFER